MDYGDYSFMIPAAAGEDMYFHRDCVVECKASLEELSGNLTREGERFEKEFLNDGCKVYLMIEALAVTLILSGINTSRSSRLLPMASLKTFEHRLAANIQFISPEYARYYIVSTFQYFWREVLKQPVTAGAHERKGFLNRRQAYVVMMKYEVVTTERKKYVLCYSLKSEL